MKHARMIRVFSWAAFLTAAGILLGGCSTAAIGTAKTALDSFGEQYRQTWAVTADSAKRLLCLDQPIDNVRKSNPTPEKMMAFLRWCEDTWNGLPIPVPTPPATAAPINLLPRRSFIEPGV